MRTHLPHNPRGAFTVIELLASIAIVAILATLTFTGVSNALDRSKRAQCLSNLRQVGLAMLLYSNDNDQQMPPYFYRSEKGHGNGKHYKIFVKPKWALANIGFLSDSRLLVCPSDKNPSLVNTTDPTGKSIKVPSSYGYNFQMFMQGFRTNELDASRTVVVFDGDPVAAQQGVWWGDTTKGSAYGFFAAPKNDDDDEESLDGHTRDLKQFNKNIVTRRHAGQLVIFFLDGHCQYAPQLPPESLFPR
jgi:prepilin-type N-terminal cleavage/methylation domain-containing protein/prepilin-type processing-associated H-X9-DG protein